MQSDIRAFVDLRLAHVAGPEPEEAMLTYLIERRLVLDFLQCQACCIMSNKHMYTPIAS